jgi:tetratricopeptide (TPR) repeat protein
MKALDLKPSFPEALVSLGMLQRSTGDRDGARESFMQATASDSKCITAHSYLTELITTKEEDERFNVLERLKTEGKRPSEQTLLLYFTLGKMYSDIGQYDKAFENYSQGNNLRKTLRGQHFSISDFECEVDTYLRIFNTDFFKQRISLGSQSNLSIFVAVCPVLAQHSLNALYQAIPRHLVQES